MDTTATPDEPRPVALRTYVFTYAVLLILATLSLLLSRIHFAGGIGVALAIAAVKACAVVWFFMHLAEQSASSRFAILVAMSLMVILVGLTAVDVDTRHTFPAKSEPFPSSVFYRR